MCSNQGIVEHILVITVIIIIIITIIKRSHLAIPSQGLIAIDMSQGWPPTTHKYV